MSNVEQELEAVQKKRDQIAQEIPKLEENIQEQGKQEKRAREGT
ncbi:MAG: hypothetical protein ABEK04_05165 [Candidatus Nanohalobium sp.]